MKIKKEIQIKPCEFQMQMFSGTYRRHENDKWNAKAKAGGAELHKGAKAALQDYYLYGVRPAAEQYCAEVIEYCTQIIRDAESCSTRPELLIEHKVQTADRLNVKGIIDAALITKERIKVYDFKTGFSRIDAKEYVNDAIVYNHQLMSYIYCLLRERNISESSICEGVIIQPAIGWKDSFLIYAGDVYRWAENIYNSLNKEQHGYKQRRLDEITDEEKIVLLKTKSIYQKLFKEIENDFMERLQNGETIPGIELTGTKTHRIFPDENEIMEILLSKKYRPEDVCKLKGILELKEIVSDEDWKILECYLVQSRQGKKLRLI